MQGWHQLCDTARCTPEPGSVDPCTARGDSRKNWEIEKEAHGWMLQSGWSPGQEGMNKQAVLFKLKIKIPNVSTVLWESRLNSDHVREGSSFPSARDQGQVT